MRRIRLPAIRPRSRQGRCRQAFDEALQKMIQGYGFKGMDRHTSSGFQTQIRCFLRNCFCLNHVYLCLAHALPCLIEQILCISVDKSCSRCYVDLIPIERWPQKARDIGVFSPPSTFKIRPMPRTVPSRNRSRTAGSRALSLKTQRPLRRKIKKKQHLHDRISLARRCSPPCCSSGCRSHPPTADERTNKNQRGRITVRPQPSQNRNTTFQDHSRLSLPVPGSNP